MVPWPPTIFPLSSPSTQPTKCTPPTREIKPVRNKRACALVCASAMSAVCVCASCARWQHHGSRASSARAKSRRRQTGRVMVLQGGKAKPVGADWTREDEPAHEIASSSVSGIAAMAERLTPRALHGDCWGRWRRARGEGTGGAAQAAGNRGRRGHDRLERDRVVRARWPEDANRGELGACVWGYKSPCIHLHCTCPEANRVPRYKAKPLAAAYAGIELYCSSSSSQRRASRRVRACASECVS
ncbi:hypothetical protein BS78_05G075700 [Paspalum vaginatum]|nr:hypothetical protein BS78_05G075700 [Paspalum vaginatum]